MVLDVGKGGLEMHRLIGLMIVFVVGIGLTACGLSLSGDFQAALVSMEHINGVIGDLVEATDVDLQPLSVGFGFGAAVSLLELARIGTLSVGLEGLVARQVDRDASVEASSLGAFTRAELARGRFRFAIDLLLARGSLDFASARLAHLAGWSLGARACVGYTLPITKALLVGVRLGYRMSPFHEMVDRSGQTYRGRGTPFMDFSGVSASIGVEWMASERSDE